MASTSGAETAAHNHFLGRDYDRAVEALQKVPQRLRGEGRVQHNLAVAAFYRGGCVEIKRLVDSLGALAAAAKAANLSDGASEDGGLGLATLSYNQAVLFYHLRRYSAALEILEGGLYRNIEALDEDLALRVCLLLVEVYLMVGQSAKAAGVLLFVEKTFCSSSGLRPGTTTSTVPGEEASTSNGGSAATGAPQRAPSPPPSSSSSSSSSSTASDRPQLCLSPEHLQFVVHLYRAKLQLLAKNAGATKKELKHGGEVLQQLMQAHQQHLKQQPNGAGTASQQLAFLKAHLEYTRRNYRKSLKLLNASQKRVPPTATTNGASSTTDSTSSSSLSSSSSSSSDGGLSGPYFNNMGCIHYQLAKYGAAAFYLAKAVREDWAATSSEATTGSSAAAVAATTTAVGVRTSRRCEMYHNQGLQLLINGKPGVAFRCLLRAADTYHHQPRLWLRLAQCVIAAHLAGERDAALRHQKSDTIARVTVHGPRHRQIQLPVRPPPSSAAALQQQSSPSPLLAIPLPASLSNTAGTAAADGTSDAVTSAASTASSQDDAGPGRLQPALTLRYGLECLRNALQLLALQREASSSSAAETPAAASAAATGSGPAPGEATANAGPGGAPAAASSLALECVCLLSMAYIALALEDPVVALNAASALLSRATNSASGTANGAGGAATTGTVEDEHRLLAHLYAAEALCMLNRTSEAMQHLSPSLIKELPASLPATASTTPSPAPGAFGPAPPTQFNLAPVLASSARYVLYINLAAAHILQDKLPQAQKCLLHATAVHAASPHALLLQTYIELVRGNTAAALDLLQRGKIVPPTALPSGGGSSTPGQETGRSSGNNNP